MLDHLRGGAEDLDMASPELGPGLLPLLQTEDEELCWPEDSPRAVCKVARDELLVRCVK